MRCFITLFLFSLLLSLFIGPKPAFAYYTNMPATVVVGQSDFTSSGQKTGSAGVSTVMRGVFIDPSGRLIVAVNNQNRVLVWNSVPTSNGVPADLVLGQPDFDTVTANTGGISASTMSGPNVVFSDGNRLFVSEETNRRVLIWNTFPTQNGKAADVVVGQANFTSTATTCNSSTTNTPEGVFVYQEKLIVAARNHRRVMVWNSIPTTNGVAADYAVGKTSLTDCTTSTVSSSNLFFPRTTQVDSEGRFIVADGSANRVLIWNTFPTESGQAADVVVGQSDFTSSSSGLSASSFNNPTAAWSSDNRLFVSDNTNNRILVFNSVPSSNGASADMVIGQPNFTSGSSNQGGSVAANTIFQGRSVFVLGNKLLTGDSNARVLIFPNILSTPQLGIKEVTAIEGNRRKVAGNVHLGEVGKYTLHNVRVSVNGGGGSFVTNLTEAFQDTNSGQTVYDWFHEFSPWDNFSNSSEWNDSLGFTLKTTASSQNADDTSLFYFSPFNLTSVSGGTINFSVPKAHVNTIKNELSHFEVWNKISSTSDWTQVDGDILTTTLNEDGVASVSLPTSGEVKVVAVSKTSNYTQNSNTLSSSFSGSYINPNNSAFYTPWYPLQVNLISGVTRNILSSFTPSGIADNYYSSTYIPTFTGIAFTGSTVAMRVTNISKPEQFRDYETTALQSSWKLTPTLYPKSVINLSVYDTSGRYNQILPLTISVTQ